MDRLNETMQLYAGCYLQLCMMSGYFGFINFTSHALLMQKNLGTHKKITMISSITLCSLEGERKTVKDLMTHSNEIL